MNLSQVFASFGTAGGFGDLRALFPCLHTACSRCFHIFLVMFARIGFSAWRRAHLCFPPRISLIIHTLTISLIFQHICGELPLYLHIYIAVACTSCKRQTDCTSFGLTKLQQNLTINCTLYRQTEVQAWPTLASFADGDRFSIPLYAE